MTNKEYRATVVNTLNDLCPFWGKHRNPELEVIDLLGSHLANAFDTYYKPQNMEEVVGIIEMLMLDDDPSTSPDLREEAYALYITLFGRCAEAEENLAIADACDKIQEAGSCYIKARSLFYDLNTRYNYLAQGHSLYDMATLCMNHKVAYRLYESIVREYR